MSELSDIHSALRSGLFAVDRLESKCVRGSDWDYVNSTRRELNDGMKAWEKLSSQLRDGKKYIEAPDDFKHTSCYCSAPTCSPPCGFCESGGGNDLDGFDNQLDGQMGGAP
jgi:hypothetical protein